MILIQPSFDGDVVVPSKEAQFAGYYKISRHYGWALNQTFFNFNFDSVIIVEGFYIYVTFKRCNTA